MSHTLLERAYQLEQEGQPFVLATVIWCERPTSAKPGAQAIIQADGRITGWIGGSCAQPVVIREATRVLREHGGPYVLRLGASEAGTTREGMRVFPMSCTSGGVLDIYMEPHLPRPHLLLIGDSPIIAALTAMAPVLNFAVTQLDQAQLRLLEQMSLDEQAFVLVASHGQYDEEALEHVLRHPAAYVGLVGSHRRAAACRAYLCDAGLTEEQIARLKAPAGLDIGAATPEEIAASVLAELVQLRRRGLADQAQIAEVSHHEQHDAQPAESDTTAIDPICGMTVEKASARHRSTYKGQEFYFCCPACKRQFERNPDEWIAADRGNIDTNNIVP